MKIEDIINLNSYILDQHPRPYSRSYEFDILDCDENIIGGAYGEKPWVIDYFKGLFRGEEPGLKVSFFDNNDNVFVIMNKPSVAVWSDIEILSPEGYLITLVRKILKLGNTSFEILDKSEKLLATAVGDWLAWNFKVVDNDEKELVSITKEYSGAKEFLGADRFSIEVEPSLDDERLRMTFFTLPLIVDIVFREGKK